MVKNEEKKYRNWFFTMNLEKDPDTEEINLFIATLKFIIGDNTESGFTMQVEKGEEMGKFHFQGVIYLKNATSFSSVKTQFNNWGYVPHIEKCNNKIKAIAYCSKENTRVKGPWNKKGQMAPDDLDIFLNNKKGNKEREEALNRLCDNVKFAPIDAYKWT